MKALIKLPEVYR